MTVQTLARKVFTSHLYEHGSWGGRHIPGPHESVMELRHTEGRYWIEWDIPSLDEFAEIGLWFDDARELVDYDGVMSIPTEALDMIEAAGFIVPPDFRE